MIKYTQTVLSQAICKRLSIRNCSIYYTRKVCIFILSIFFFIDVNIHLIYLYYKYIRYLYISPLYKKTSKNGQDIMILLQTFMPFKYLFNSIYFTLKVQYTYLIGTCNMYNVTMISHVIKQTNYDQLTLIIFVTSVKSNR